MKRFYYFLKDNPRYPQVIMAKSKGDVLTKLINDMGEHARDFVLNIVSEEELRGKPEISDESQVIENVDSETNKNDDFVTNAMNMLKSNNIQQNQQTINSSNEFDNNLNQDSTAKFFIAGGEEFKFENGRLYKKAWCEVEDQTNFRIVKSDTNKPIKSDKYKIETLIWKETEG